MGLIRYSKHWKGYAEKIGYRTSIKRAKGPSLGHPGFFETHRKHTKSVTCYSLSLSKHFLALSFGANTLCYSLGQRTYSPPLLFISLKRGVLSRECWTPWTSFDPTSLVSEFLSPLIASTSKNAAFRLLLR